MKKIFTFIYIFAVAAIAANTLSAQSKTFKLGQWTEIQNSIVRELNRSYVDSLPVDRIMKAGIDAMLEELDPYTVYIPEEENEDFQMMISNTYGGIGAIIKKAKGGNVIINEPYFGSPAHKAGLSCGDEILEIDGEVTTDFTASESSSRMKGKPGTTVVYHRSVFHIRKMNPFTYN
jgi:carboxyl-terminal processing protease